MSVAIANRLPLVAIDHAKPAIIAKELPTFLEDLGVWAGIVYEVDVLLPV